MASSDTDDVISIAEGAFVNECKKKLISANEAFGLVSGQKNVKTRAYHSLVTKRKVNKQQLSNQRSAFSATCCADTACCYSDLGCASCCSTQTCNKSPAARLRNKSPQQKSTCVITVSQMIGLCPNPIGVSYAGRVSPIHQYNILLPLCHVHGALHRIIIIL